MAEGLQAAYATVAAHPAALEWAQPRGGTFAFVRLLGSHAATPYPSSETYCDALRARAQLMLLPGSLFDLDAGDVGHAGGVEHAGDQIGDEARILDQLPRGSDSAQRVRLTYGRRQTARLLERWSDDLNQHPPFEL